MDDIPSSQILAAESSPEPDPMVPGLDFSSIPPISVISTHFKDDEEDKVRATLRRHNATIAADVSKTKVFIGRVGTKKRADFELRSRKFKVREVTEPKRAPPQQTEGPPRKRLKLSASSAKPIVLRDDGSTTEEEGSNGSETEDEGAIKGATPATSPIEPEEATPPTFDDSSEDDLVWVVRVDWLDACLAAGHLVAVSEHIVFTGKVLERPPPPLKYKSIKSVFASSSKTTPQSASTARPQEKQTIVDRAKADAPKSESNKAFYQPHRKGRVFPSSSRKPAFASQTAHLLQQTTSDYEGEDSDVPPPPDWVKKGLIYSCQRFTPAESPNSDFIAQLKKIRTARILSEDEIGVRAYSTIIASISAYPHKLIHPRELAQLPGCDEKTALLFAEWKNTGTNQEVENYENDEEMKVLRTFYDIWGVGAKTARTFLKKRGWTELDDIIEFGWDTIDRVQQIGIKYYEEFLEGIPRTEVESIADVVRQHAVRLRDDRITVTIVGGYRRGKSASGDVDLIVSHPDLSATSNLVKDLVTSLEDEEWITHTLTLSLHNTHRNQTTLPFRSTRVAGGVGFDTLDKALVVWQDPVWPTRDADREKDPKARNPNVHRRVDIIISPWRTVGCAVMGWSGGTTFQRDLRRYARKVKGWKFDSSGIRSRVTGEVVQVEGPDGVKGTPEDAERAVFEGLGLEYVPPEYRCTN
ncbi:terminal deoxynucleotidyl transferas-like protein [Byssothecium circinans]|uniref:DNA polymerase n=1 Tax=Byssothecium circinans TaxID=147558 RepID=A0A6A5UE46_9PLEO|nr:terminal deoxynucleotidyl transferas-like protein [Byssothecium circinans]